MAWISRYATLEPGNVILTGTPAGVGTTSGRFLRAGQLVQVEIEGMGRLRVPGGDGTFAVLNPATGQVLAEVASGSGSDIDTAVGAARAALSGEWGAMPGAERAHPLAGCAGESSSSSYCDATTLWLIRRQRSA